MDIIIVPLPVPRWVVDVIRNDLCLSTNPDEIRKYMQTIFLKAVAGTCDAEGDHENCQKIEALIARLEKT